MIVAKYSSRELAERACAFYGAEEEYARWRWRVTYLPGEEPYCFAVVQVPKSQLKDTA